MGKSVLYETLIESGVQMASDDLITSKVAAIRTAICESYERRNISPTSLWCNAKTMADIKQVHWYDMMPPKFNKVVPDSEHEDEAKKFKWTFLGMEMIYGAKLPENMVVLCTGEEDHFGIPHYKRVAVITLKETTNYSYHLQMEPHW